MARVTRRDFVKTAAAGAVAAGGAMASAQPQEKKPPEPDALSAADVAAIEKVEGRAFNDAERQQLLKSLTETRAQLKAVRVSALAHDFDPAFVFQAALPDTVLPRAGGSVRVSRGGTPKYDGHPESLAFATVVELSRLLKARKVTSTALTRMYLERLKTYGPRLLCVVEVCEARALAEAEQADREIAAGKWRGPLHGVPYGLKDLFAAEGSRTTFGAPPYKGQRWEFDSTVTARLKDAGAVLVAKLSMGELAMGDVWFGGTTRTPWDATRGSSGSSAGSASATAAGLLGFALGTETYGSIVSPSIRCGVTGLRPTFGRVSRHGAMALSWTMDKIGPICRGVEDCALVFAAIQGPDGHDRSVLPGVGFDWNPGKSLKDLRVGVDTKGFEKAGAPQKAALEVLKTLGIDPKPVTLPAANPAYDALPDLTILTEGAAAFADLAERGGLRELVQQADWNWPNALRLGATVPAADYLNAQRVRRHLQRAMGDALKDIDVYVTPAGSTPSITWTNLTGHPTVVTRCGLTAEGMPAMLEFTGSLFREDAALRLAWAYERAAGMAGKWPDLSKLPADPPALAKRPDDE